MPRRPHRSAVLAVVLGISLVVGCSPAEEAEVTTTTGAVTSTSTDATTLTTIPSTTTTAPSTTTTEAQGDVVTVLLQRFGAMGPEWTEQTFPYGDDVAGLGTAPGGDGLMLGPEYGTQVPDSTWWFMDAAKLRFAHFAGDGDYLGEVEIPEAILVDGQYFQYQNPIALDDGRILASGFRGEANMSLLTFDGVTMTSATLADSTPWVTTDGDLLYGFSLADSTPRSLLPEPPTVEEVEWFLARDGTRYMIRVDGSDVTVELPDADVTKTLQLRFADDPAVDARAGIEVETGSDGTIFVLFYGAPLSDESLGIGSLVTISPTGYVSEAEPIVDPFSMSDPGSPSHLGVTPGTAIPWIMVVGEDGVHVHLRTG